MQLICMGQTSVKETSPHDLAGGSQPLLRKFDVYSALALVFFHPFPGAAARVVTITKRALMLVVIGTTMVASGRANLLAGPLAQETAQESQNRPKPFHGYYYRILKGQGTHAPGGVKKYLINGKMTGGFAFVAHPAGYRDSGVMTFIVSQDGIVYQKDLGPNTVSSARTLSLYDPDAN